MKKNARFFYINILSIIVLMISVILLNYKLDPYGIWKVSFENQILEPNKNYVKTKYIINNPHKYDSFIFGSSRVGHIETNLLESGRFYNMTYSEGLPQEWLENIKTLLKNGVLIKNIVLGIDDFSFTINPENHKTQLMRVPYEELDSKRIFEMYLLRNPSDAYNLESIKGLIKNNYEYAKYDDILESGATFGNDNEILINPQKHVEDPKFNEPSDRYELNRIDDTINEINDIIEVCKENNISIHIFFNPINKITYEKNKDITEQAKKKLQKITDYWDFSGDNDINNNNFYWYETSHYRNIVGKMIMEKMFNIDLGIKVPYNFGVYKNKE